MFRNSSNFLSKGIGKSIDLAWFWAGKIKIIKTKTVSVFATKTKIAGASTKKKSKEGKRRQGRKKQSKKNDKPREKKAVLSTPVLIAVFFFFFPLKKDVFLHPLPYQQTKGK